MKELREQLERELVHGVNLPILILVMGGPLTGTSTIGEFFKQHLKSDEEDYIDEDKIKLLSTDSVN